MTNQSYPGFIQPPSLQILHLEDNAADCALVQDAVHTGGLPCAFTVVESKEQFLAALHTRQFAVILADYTVPGYDGVSALAAARQIQPETPFIFVSGTIGEERAIEVLKEGATDYVLKDRLARLVPSIRRAVQEAREREARNQTERALHASEARFREMADNIREVFWTGSPDGRHILYASPACVQIWNRPLASLQGRPENWLECVALEHRARVSQARAQAGQGTSYCIEYVVMQPDGGQHWVEEHGYPVHGAQGHVERSVGVAMDITARKQLEEQLQQSQKMEAIGQLAGGIAHDFGNMLTVINGYSNLLLDNPVLPPNIAATLRQIYIAGGRAASLTRQLLIFSRRNQPHNQAVDLNEIVDDTAAMLRRLIGEHITLQLDLAHPLPNTFADTGMIEQVLMNLVVNARDAMPKGGGLVISTGSCAITPDQVRTPEARPGAYVWLSVRDTGCGIPASILPRIFEPFFTTKEAGKGTGLGLATVFGIAKQLHGWVEVESEPGIGSAFRLLLPACELEKTSGASLAQSPFVAGGKETILLVEDELSVREYARTVLEMHGYKVLQAASGVEALDAWKWHREKISLLLTDVVMPDDMTGMELAERLKADRPDLPVLFCSGYSEEIAGQVLAPGAGPFSFLHKPYQPKTLARMVREVIDQGSATASASRAPFD